MKSMITLRSFRPGRLGLLAILVALMMSVTIPAARAGVVYSTGFEPPTYTLGNLVGQDGWQIFGPATVLVENSLVQSGVQAVSVDGSVVSQSGPFHADVATGPLVQLSAGIYIASSSNQSEWQFSGLASGLAPFMGGINVLPGGAIQLQTPGFPTVGTFSYDTWHNVRYVFDITTQTFDFYLDNSLISANAPFVGGFVGAFGDGLFDTFGGGNDFGYIDNYSVANVSGVPEPASITLFGSGVLGLAAAARRRFKS
jgi:hypothetical protein